MHLGDRVVNRLVFHICKNKETFWKIMKFLGTDTTRHGRTDSVEEATRRNVDMLMFK